MNQKIAEKFTIIFPAKTWNHQVEDLIKSSDIQYPNIKIICVLNEDLPKEVTISQNLEVIICDGTIASKRNRGAKEVLTDYIMFIDSDATLCEMAMENALKRFESNPQIEVIGGPNLPPAESSRSEIYTHRACLSPIISGASFYEKTISHSKEVDHVPSCNMYVKTKSYLGLGGMNEKMRTGEDLEYCLRVKSCGGIIFFDSDVRVFHFTRNLKGFFLQRFTWGYNIFNIIKSSNSTKFIYMGTPFYCTIFAIILIIIKAYSLLLGLMILYICIIIFESIRLGKNVREISILPIYLIVGNMSPALGSWFFIFNNNYNIYKLYNNLRNEHL